MKLSVYSLKNILFQGEAESLNCNTLAGQITVLNNHVPLIAVLKKGVIKIIDKNNKTSYIQVSSGFLEVRSNNEARCIIEEEKA